MEEKNKQKKAMCESADKHNRKHVQKYKKNVRVIQLKSKRGCSEHKRIEWRNLYLIKKNNILVTSVTDAPLLNQQLKFECSTFSHNSHFSKGGRRKAQSLKY